MKTIATCLKGAALVALAPLSIACTMVGAVSTVIGVGTAELVSVIGESIATDIKKTES